ncbi:M23 family metallopeptidase [Thalassotalea profundi]|uniref:Periplasmic metalloprotease M23B family protein n=1 Tax=Thalassotalea profundi TaxID=2036687 RepID=A0ABQ3IIQ6_9GAMM|nr:M23 family metallopeptidase [Thalassotalea profundi]GHE82820.1 periplasmic metalloprotease M23B family protein [Thalassotalea profundi]
MFKNKLAIHALILSLASSLAANSYAEIKLSGSFTQGGMIIGKTLPSNTVQLNQRTLKVSETGDFVFGFSWNDTNDYTLTITDENGEIEQKSFTPTVREYKKSNIKGIAKKIMNPDPANVARSKEDRKKTVKARTHNSDFTYFAQGFIAPRDTKVTGVYGSQRLFNGVLKSTHFGVDYRGQVGAPVKAPASGVVTLWVPDMFYSGGTLIIDHGHGVNSTFLHLSKSYVNLGDKVEKHDKIAEVGASGRATGPHLDWRVNWFDVRLDPELVMQTTPFN